MATKATIKLAERALTEAQGMFYNARNKLRSTQARTDQVAEKIAAGQPVRHWEGAEEGELELDQAWYERAQNAMFDAEAALHAEKIAYRENPRRR